MYTVTELARGAANATVGCRSCWPTAVIAGGTASAGVVVTTSVTRTARHTLAARSIRQSYTRRSAAAVTGYFSAPLVARGARS